MAATNEIYQYLSSNADDGNAINFNVETHQKSWGADFEKIIEIVQIEVEIIQGNNVGVWYQLDNGPWRQKGTVKRGFNRVNIDVDSDTGDFPRCRIMRIGFREISQSKLTIGTVAVRYYETEDEEEERD